MWKHRLLRKSWLAFFTVLFAVVLFVRAEASNEYVPEAGQAGKDVIWLPTEKALVEKMLDMAKITPNDYVIDLGSGDGRTVIAAAMRGARALGIEYDAEMVEYSRRLAEKAGVSDRAKFIKADLFKTDFSQATVLTMFLLPDINLKLRPTILNLKPGTRVVSNSFTMGDWFPDQTAFLPESQCSDYCKALFWIVPAKVEGGWKLDQSELTLKQTFQTISGNLKSQGRNTPIKNGRLNGEEINFTAGGIQYTGRVNGDAMEGTFNSNSRGGTVKWKGIRLRTAE